MLDYRINKDISLDLFTALNIRRKILKARKFFLTIPPLETFFVGRQNACLYKEVSQNTGVKQWLNEKVVAVVVHHNYYEIILVERPRERIRFYPEDFSLWVNGEDDKEALKKRFSEVDLMAICQAIDEEDFRRRGQTPSRKPKRQEVETAAFSL